MSRRVLILGGGSAIAFAYARLRAAQGCHLVLAGRRTELLEANAADLVARGAAGAEVVAADLADAGALPSLAERLFTDFPDEVLIAYGSLPDQAAAASDLGTARTALEVNLVSPALWLLALLKARPHGRPLSVAVIGSVAGDRGRASNFIYGAAKGGLARLIEGLQHANAGSEVSITLVKPGFVMTPMTENIAGRGGPLWATPEAVGAAIARAVDRRRPEVYAPGFWRLIMLIIRHLPRMVFNRMKI
jgi:decaprenylphospho-beta-D-erythro-pentofuranosid-2-ulose 2-reductase